MIRGWLSGFWNIQGSGMDYHLFSQPVYVAHRQEQTLKLMMGSYMKNF